MTHPSMERVLYQLHHQLCSFALQHTTTWGRKWAERLLLVAFLTGCTVTLLLHVTFVHRDTTTLDGKPLHSIPLTCLRNIPGFSDQMDVTHISLRLWEDNNDSIGSYAYQWGDGNATCDTTTIPLPYYSYSKIQGYLLLTPELCHNIRVQSVVIARNDPTCWGPPWMQHIVFAVKGHETVMINWLLGTFHGQGFLYNPRSKILYDWSQYSFDSQLSSKVGVVLQTCFLFFMVTTLVSFILRETQERMLAFTNQLQTRVRQRRPITSLVGTHLVENLVFVPVLVGMMFFLIEFYRGDKVVAFVVLSLIWICEAFSIISLRSKEGMHFFPRMFFWEFSIVHFYMFMFPFGYSYMALASTAVCVMHSMLFFWHRYELPAVALGHVTLEHPRMGTMMNSNGTSSSDPFWFDHHHRQTLRHPQPLSSHPISGQSSNSLERLSREGSSIFNIAGDDDDSVSSYMYLLNGEVVVHRHRSSPTAPTTASEEIRSEERRESSLSTDRPSTPLSSSPSHAPSSPVSTIEARSNAPTPRVHNRTPTE
ncbi:hypothetical protein FisN_11Hh235 [Fistulifera solaris]|uniref:Membralin n=1 Tax=Fistulifera solaris TaxID=1519565 RepID=A0A1Z5JL33_FISSO|nr:hypothetical protein FisN_11Hh235 [Fistulifera solaris]|eukprot:GAX14694.1 hypothetical protein FisN_11Hh235 [Fistulifera solaris]